MKDAVANLIRQALVTLAERGTLDPSLVPADIRVERARERGHADLASNVALVMAGRTDRNPRELATEIAASLPADARVARTEVAGPGFLNFFLDPAARAEIVAQILEAGVAFGYSRRHAGTSVQVEFVSANPTGPLHVGHGRGAAYGACIANVLEAVGHDVQREYYVNDAGRQMNILAVSVWLRYLEQLGHDVRFPVNGYHGDYVRRVGASLFDVHGDDLRRDTGQLRHDLPPDEADGGDREQHVDALVRRTRELLGEQWTILFEHACAELVAGIRADLAAFRVEYDCWYSERGLYDSGAVDRALGRLRERGYLYERDGATWFRATTFGDDKDRVVVRENGVSTYFASDIAYHMDKLERGFDRLVNVWGADHHGYVARVQAALRALGASPDCLDVLLVQFAVLYRGGKKVSMSTRSGEFVTLRELIDEVGTDAARFLYVLRRCDQHLDFDIDLAKTQSQDNPVYYVQYAHARIHSVMRQLAAKGYSWDRDNGLACLDRLGSAHELALMEALERFPEVVEEAATERAPHRLCYYLLEDVATAFHTWYNAEGFIVDDDALRDGRLALVQATGQVIRNGLALVGVSAPEAM